MAHLGSKTSDGRVSFEKYVSTNPKWHTGMKFVVENGVSNAPLVEIKTNKPIDTKLTVSQEDGIYIMSKVYKTLKNKRYTKIKTVDSSGVQGYLDLRFIRKPTSADVMKTELRAIKELDSVIRKIEVPITIVVDKTAKCARGKYRAENIIEARKIGGTPKADLALFDKYGVPIFWISHKKEGDASAFQQYSGISAQSGASIYQHKECKNFMRKVVEYLEGEHEYDRENEKAIRVMSDSQTNNINKEKMEGILRKNGLLNASRQLSNMNMHEYKLFLKNPEFDSGELITSSSKLSTPLWSRISDPMLRRMAIYGPDVMIGNKFGQNNIQMIGQGTPILTPMKEDDTTFKLSFSSHTSTNEDISGLGGDYEPVFIATYRAGRGFTVDNKTYKGARLGIAPYAMVKNRQGIIRV